MNKKTLYLIAKELILMELEKKKYRETSEFNVKEELEIKRLLRYDIALDNLARIKSKENYPNKNHRHAAIALSKILKYSDYKFILFDDDLKGDIVKNDKIVSFRNSVLEFISRGGKLVMVISDKKEGDDKRFKLFLENLEEVFPSRVQILLASPEFKTSMKEIFNQKINYAIGDHNKIRLEKFGNNGSDEKTRIAEVSFNDEQRATLISEIFWKNIPSCTHYFAK